MDNIIKANIRSQSTFTRSVWQYDYGQILQITGAELPPAVEVQFSLAEKSGETITRVATTTDGVTEVQIPNELLKRDGCMGDYYIYAFIYVTDEKSGNTKYKIAIMVNKRPKPEEPTQEPEQEENLFHATVVAVNAAADRAEAAVKDTEQIRDNLNFDLSEKITRPDTAEVGQVLAVKEIDESGKPSVFEAVDVKAPTKTSQLENDSGFLTEHQDISGKLDKEKLPEAIDDALAQAKESGEFDGKDGAPGEKGDPGETTYVENPYDDTAIKEDVEGIKQAFEDSVEVEVESKTPLWTPESAEVGQLLRVKSKNDDGSVVLETVEMPTESVSDIQINGNSIVGNSGIAEIPIGSRGKPGVLGIPGGTYGLDKDDTNNIRIIGLTNGEVDKRFYAKPVMGNTLDYAVKCAMTDGKGAAWTVEEQVAARERMGIDEWEDVITYITSSEEEECTTCYIDFEHTYRKIYVLIDESAIEGTTYMSTRFGVIGKNKLHNVALIANTSPAFSVKNKYKTFLGEVMNTADVSYQYTATGTAQLYSYCEQSLIGRAGPPSITAVDASAIGGIMWYGKMYAGTVITVKGVRA